MKPHPLFNVWSPDEVAECLPGVTNEDYNLLWETVASLPKNISEMPDCFAERAVKNIWSRLPKDAQARLNALAEAQNAKEADLSYGYDD